MSTIEKIILYSCAGYISAYILAVVVLLIKRQWLVDLMIGRTLFLMVTGIILKLAWLVAFLTIGLHFVLKYW